MDINKLINDILINKSNTESNLNIKSSFSSTLKEARKQFEKEYLITQLKKNQGNISKTAEFIGKFTTARWIRTRHKTWATNSRIHHAVFSKDYMGRSSFSRFYCHYSILGYRTNKR